jgi:hypothetical protein
METLQSHADRAVPVDNALLGRYDQPARPARAAWAGREDSGPQRSPWRAHNPDQKRVGARGQSRRGACRGITHAARLTKRTGAREVGRTIAKAARLDRADPHLGSVIRGRSRSSVQHTTNVIEFARIKRRASVYGSGHYHQVPLPVPTPASRACTIAWERSDTPSLVKMLET